MLHSIRWRIALPFVLIILLATLGLSLYTSHQLRRARLADLETRLLTEAHWLSEDAQTALRDPLRPDLPALVHLAETAAASGERLTIIDRDGVVLAESHADVLSMDNHLRRPEIRQALLQGQGSATRFSTTLQQQIMYAAVAVREGDALLGFVRVALPFDEIEANANQLTGTLVAAGLVTAAVSVLLALVVALHTINPVRRLTAAAQRVAAGDLSARLLPTSRDEVGQLTRAFNHMTDELNEQITASARERGRLSAVLNTMGDGVLITDDSARVTLINPGATRILRADPDKSLGRTLAQVVYTPELIELWNLCQQTGREQTATMETILHGSILHAVISPLREISPPGYLIILQDLTRLQRLETIRRDFVSNISHELRTPLASLSLVVETLRDGAIEDPPAARRFLSYMENELDTLTQMVEELLELAKIESGKVPLNLKPTRVNKLVRKPIRRLQPQAEHKGVALTLSIPVDLPRVLADAKRIQQVVTNLVHNAIKFTPAGGVITVFAAQPESLTQIPADPHAEALSPSVIIGVTDTGVGIPAEDLPRIFERFYKTDRARAQEGTGLGLAIAKHLVQAHRGQLWVESAEGVGSTFYFSLPIAPGEPPVLDVSQLTSDAPETAPPATPEDFLGPGA